MRAEIYSLNNLKSGRLSIMAHPRGGDWLEDEIKALRAAEVDILVSLLTSDEITQLNLAEEVVLCRTNGIEFLTLPIPDRGVPPLQPSTFELLSRLKVFLEEGKHVAVHCRIGIGRSSLVAASVLNLTGISVDDAFNLLTLARGRPLPDTEEQRAWVENFARGHFT